MISGGKQVTGWTPADSAGKVYKAKVGDIDTRQLYVNGELETRARSAKNPPGFSKTSTGYTFTDTSHQRLQASLGPGGRQQLGLEAACAAPCSRSPATR